MSKRSILWLIVIVIVVVLAIIILQFHEQQPIDSKPKQVTVNTIQKQMVPDVLKAYGTVITSDAQKILSQADGTITKILYKSGQWVDKGMPLFDIDTPTLETDLSSAKADLDYAKHKYEMYRQVYKKGAVTKVDLEQMKDAYLKAKQDYQSKLNSAKYTQVLSPISGYVTPSPLADGSVVKNGDVLASIVPKSGYEVSYHVDQKWRQYIVVGQAATINVTPEEMIQAKVSYVAPSATDVHSFEVRVTFDAAKHQLFPGMTEVVTQLLNKHLMPVVPQSSVGSDAQGFYVFTVVQGKLKKVYFKVKSVNNDNMVIETGLKQGDTYVTSDVSDLTEGEKVEVKHAVH